MRVREGEAPAEPGVAPRLGGSLPLPVVLTNVWGATNGGTLSSAASTSRKGLRDGASPVHRGRRGGRSARVVRAGIDGVERRGWAAGSGDRGQLLPAGGRGGIRGCRLQPRSAL